MWMIIINYGHNYHCLTWVSSVEPHRPVWNKKMSSPWGSPITSDKRWNVVRGTAMRRAAKSIWAERMNEPYFARQRCIPVMHNISYNSYKLRLYLKDQGLGLDSLQSCMAFALALIIKNYSFTSDGGKTNMLRPRLKINTRTKTKIVRPRPRTVKQLQE